MNIDRARFFFLASTIAAGACSSNSNDTPSGNTSLSAGAGASGFDNSGGSAGLSGNAGAAGLAAAGTAGSTATGGESGASPSAAGAGGSGGDSSSEGGGAGDSGTAGQGGTGGGSTGGSSATAGAGGSAGGAPACDLTGTPHTCNFNPMNDPACLAQLACTNGNTYLKPKVAENLGQCLDQIVAGGMNGCNAAQEVNTCILNNLSMACADTNATATCIAINQHCTNVAVADCQKYLNGATEGFRTQVNNCMQNQSQGVCTKSISSCIESVLFQRP